MQKTGFWRKLVSGAVCAALSVSCFAALAPTAAVAEESVALTDTDMLRQDGVRLVNQNGEVVQLRGVNIGGWLLQETWMCPVDGTSPAYWDTLQTLESRFGAEKTAELVKIYEDNWFTEADIDNLQSLGFNVLRVPFWYRTLQTDDEGTWKLNENGEIDFSRLDWVVEECGKRGIYVILDLHGAPGHQSVDHCCGRIGKTTLWTDEKYQNLTVELWTEVARHFADNPVVAGYDLLNEPMNGINNKLDSQIWKLYDKIYDGIRTVDSNHVLIMEGIWDLANLPNPSYYQWTNVMYSCHNYNYARNEIDKKVKDYEAKINIANWNVPMLVGEFQPGEIGNYVFNAYNEAGFSWTTWTYKGAKSGPSTWFLFNGRPEAVNPAEDSYEEIARKWGTVSTDESFKRNNSLAEMMTKYATAPVVDYSQKTEETDPTTTTTGAGDTNSENNESGSWLVYGIVGACAAAVIAVVIIVVAVSRKKKNASADSGVSEEAPLPPAEESADAPAEEPSNESDESDESDEPDGQ